MYQVCPVCEGRGVKERAFYPDLAVGTAAEQWVKCRSCNGCGTLYSADPLPLIPFIQPINPWPYEYPITRYSTYTTTTTDAPCVSTDTARLKFNSSGIVRIEGDQICVSS